MPEVNYTDTSSTALLKVELSGKWADCPGKVVVRDINDNTPTFEHSAYLIKVEEEKTMKQKLEVVVSSDIGYFEGLAEFVAGFRSGRW